MIGLGATSGSSDAGTEGLLNLLAVVSDPAATKARLEQLAAKNAEAAATLQKITALNKDIEKKQKEHADAQAATSQLREALATKENDLKAREAKLANDLGDLTIRIGSLAADKKVFEQVSAAKEAELTKRASDLTKAEQDNAAQLKAALDASAKELADHKAALETEHKTRLHNARALQDQADANREATAAALTTAEEQRIFYENRVSALQKAMQGPA